MFSKNTLMAVSIIFLLTINAVIIVISSRQFASFERTGTIIVQVTGGFQKTSQNIINSFKSIWKYYIYLVNAAKENEQLKASLQEKDQIINDFNEKKLLYERLQNLVSFTQKNSYQTITAEIISKDPSAWFNAFTISKGADSGIKNGMPVISPDGIVGRIVEVSSDFSKVILITDRNCAVDSIIQNSRARGIVKGNGTNSCILDYLLNEHEVKEGDLIISSGSDKIYPKGLKIGTIIKAEKNNSALFQKIYLKPFVDFTKLEEVLVIIN